jgi:adenylate cyclase
MSHLEIERKFLLRSDDWRQHVRASMRLRQGYLNYEKRCSVRVRIAGEQAWLNLKGTTVGAQRLEFEYAIPLTDADRMLASLTCKPLIEKTRHLVDVGRHTFEIDEFAGDNQGLIVAEIELNDPDEPFEKPDWLGAEVTEDPRYYNTCLAAHPYKNWR